MIFKLVYGELAGGDIQFGADASKLQAAIDQIVQILRTYNNAIEESVRVSAQFTNQGIRVTGSLQQQAEAGRVLTTTVKGLITEEKTLSETLRINQVATTDTIEKERKLLQQRKELRKINEEVARTNKEIAQNRKAAARATTTKILGGISPPTFKASTEEARAFGNELGRLSELQQRFNLSQQRVLSIFQNVRRGGVNAYTGVERQVANSAASIIRAQQRLGTSAKREFGKLTAAVKATKLKQLRDELGRVEKVGVKSAKNMEISFRSFGRLVFVNVVSRAFGSLLNVLRESIDLARDFSIRIAEIRTISRGNQLTFEQWTKGVRELSEAFGLTAIDVAEGTYQILSNQVAEGAKAFEFQKQAALFARAAVATNAESVNLLTSAINSFSLQSEDANRVTDIFFKTIELGRLRASDLATTFGRVAVLGSQLGVSLEELNAAIATITIQGVKADEALTGLRNLFLKLIRPTDAMKEKFKELGVASGDVLIATRSFQGVIKLFADVLEREGTPAIGKFFGRVRAIIPVLLLAGSGFERFSANLEEVVDSAGAATRAAGEILRVVGARFERELTKLRNFFTVEVGIKLLKRILNITKSFGGLATVIITLTQAIIVATAAFAAIKIIIVSVKLATIALTVSTVGLKVATKALTLLLETNPYGILALGIAAAATALLTLTANTRTFEEEVNDRIPEVTARFAEFFALQIREARRAGKAIAAGVEIIFREQLQLVAGVRSTLNTVLKENEKALIEITKSLRAKFKEIGSVFKSEINAARRNAENASRAFDESIRRTSELLFEQFKINFDFSLEGLEDPEVINKLKGFINKLSDTLSEESKKLGELGFGKFDTTAFNQAASEIQQRIEQLRNIRQQASQQAERLEERQIRLIQRRNDIQSKFSDRLRVVVDQFRKARGNREKLRQIEEKIERILNNRTRALNKINRQIKKNQDESAEIQRIDLTREEIQKRTNDLLKKQLDFQRQIRKESKIAEEEAEKERKKLEKSLILFRENFRRFIDLKPEKIFTEGFEAAKKQVNETTDLILENLERLDPIRRAELELKIKERQTKLLENLEIRQQDKLKKIEADALIRRQKDSRKTFEAIAREREKITVSLIESQSKTIAQFEALNKRTILSDEESFRVRERALKIFLGRNRKEIEKQAKFLEKQAEKLRAEEEKEKRRQPFSLGVISLTPAKIRETDKIVKILRDFLSNTEDQKTALETIDTIFGNIGKKLNIAVIPSKALADNLNAADTALKGIVLSLDALVKSLNKLPAKLPAGLLGLPKQFGGLIPGTGNRDSVPALLTPGEFVVNASATRKFFSQLVAINSGVRPRGFQEGGMVNNIGDINVSVTAPQGVDGREIARVLKQELFRRSVRLQ